MNSLVAEGEQPALTAEGAHLPNVIEIHDSVPVDPFELGSAEASLDCVKGLRGEEAPLGCDNPDQFSFGLESKNVVSVE